MDVVVWTESEERERWWREVVGITVAGDRCMATDVGELPMLSTNSNRSGLVPASLGAVTAA